MKKIDTLQKKANELPSNPGVYIMKDKDNNIIYIGKAKSLKNRVSQYFRSQDRHTEKVKTMVSHVNDFEYILTDSEFEALVLECSLIKQYKPKYNILLKDDKGYHYIKITHEDYPRISTVNNMDDDNSTYLGPYTSSSSISNIVDEAIEIFKLPTCNRSFSKGKRTRPCLSYYINKCCAPCTGKVDKLYYNENINDAISFLKGSNTSILNKLNAKMQYFSNKLDFEKAADIRDRIKAINKIQEKQKVVFLTAKEQDVIGIVQSEKLFSIEIFHFAEGKLFDRENHILKSDENTIEVRTEFLKRYYSEAKTIPPTILIDGKIKDEKLLLTWLFNISGKKVSITVPKRGEPLKLIEMCKNNAAERLSSYVNRNFRETASLNELKELLNLEKTPTYIESYDISHTSGSDNVAGMIVFKNARPLKSSYRKFKIKGFVGQNDYESMKEIINRRLNEYENGNNKDPSFSQLPDLILLDGGKGQVSAVKAVLKDRGYDIPTYGMVKNSKHRTRAITDDGNEISLTSKQTAFSLISKIQEEVHRFAINYHRKLHNKNSFLSSLMEIPGVGKKRSKALIKHFKSIDSIKSATKDELTSVDGINQNIAENILDFLSKKS